MKQLGVSSTVQGGGKRRGSTIFVDPMWTQNSSNDFRRFSDCQEMPDFIGADGGKRAAHPEVPEKSKLANS
jgi:hypothetical protein